MIIKPYLKKYPFDEGYNDLKQKKFVNYKTENLIFLHTY